MTRVSTWLALGLVLLGGAACSAGEIGTAQLPADALPAAATATHGTPAAPAAVITGVASVQGCASCGGCAPAGCIGGGHAGHPCLHRLCDWLTYCPPKAPCCCHLGCASCGGCSCGKCTPCCMPPYMYFLDRCSCTLGYHPAPPHPPVPLSDDRCDLGAGPPTGTGTPASTTPTTIER